MSSAALFHVLAASHRQAHAEEHTTKLARLHSADQILEHRAGHARLGDQRLIDSHSLDHGPQDRDQFKILARANLQENVGGLGALGLANVDEHHRAIFATARQKLALLHDGVLGEMARMALGRVSAPVHNKIGSLFHFAERTGYFATQLGGDLGWPVSERRVAIEQSAQGVC